MPPTPAARASQGAPTDWHAQELLLMREVMRLIGRSLAPGLVLREMLHLMSELLGLNRGRIVLVDDAPTAPAGAPRTASIQHAYGLTQADYASRTPHAWQAGPQTSLLASQLAAMQNGTFVMTIPKAPYRCPPGPYERACLVADYLKTYRGAGSRVIVLDENATIQAERETFTHAFGVTHAGVIRYEAGVTGIQIDPVSRRVSYLDAVGNPQVIDAQAINPIPPHRATGSSAGGWLAAAGLNNSVDGRWCVVDVLSYESTAQPGIHVIGDASSCGLPKAGHVANQEAKICADAIVRLLAGQQPDPAPVANSACYSPITAGTASWLTAVYQYDGANRKMVLAANGGNTVGATAIESASVSSGNFRQMTTWFNTLMGDSFG